MNRFSAAVAAFISLGAPAFATDACAPGAVMAYPAENTIWQRGFELRHFDIAEGQPRRFEDFVNHEAHAEMAELRSAFLADERQPRRDAVLLRRFVDYFAAEEPLRTLTTEVHADMIAASLDALDNHGLGEVAELVREANALYGDETDSQERRYLLGHILGVNRESGDYGVLNQQFAKLEERFAAHRDRVLETATELFMNDPELSAEIDAARRATDQETQIRWAVGKLWGCVSDAELRQGAELSVALPQHDFLALSVFRRTVEMDQLYPISTASQWADLFVGPRSSWTEIDIPGALDRNGLTDQAAALRALADMFLGEGGLAASYDLGPQNSRSFSADVLDDAEAERLQNLLREFDADAAFSALVDLAVSSGLMPELADAPNVPEAPYR